MPGPDGHSIDFDTKIGEMAGDDYIFHVNPDPSTSPAALRGKLLLAGPSLHQSIFHKSVILINEHQTEEGAMGLVLNHPTGKVVGDFLKDKSFAPLRNLAVHNGGPVGTHQLTFSSFWWNQESGLCWAIQMSPQQAAKHASQPGRMVHAFLGYSGWSAGQLENELQSASWLPIEPVPQLLGLTHDTELWHQLFGGISPMHRLMANAPDDPTLN